jgi:TetR/AcrR family transcriptional regulator
LSADASPCNGPRVRRRRKHARAEELRDAALALFVEKGFDAALAEEIAARAGISKGTLYLYYPSKESLLKAAIDSPALEVLATAWPAADGGGNSADVVRRVLSSLWARLRDGTAGSILKLAIAEARRFPEIMEVWQRKVGQPARSLIAEVVRQGMDRGELRRMDADIAAHALLTPIFVSCLHPHVIDPGAAADRCPDERFIAQHVELVLQGLRR